VCAFHASNYGRKKNERLALFCHDETGYVFGALGANRVAAFWAVVYADACVKQPKVIVDFRYGAYGGAGVFAGAFLFNGDGWR